MIEWIKSLFHKNTNKYDELQKKYEVLETALYTICFRHPSSCLSNFSLCKECPQANESACQGRSCGTQAKKRAEKALREVNKGGCLLK